MSRTHLLLVLCVALLIGLGATAFFATFEHKEHTRQVGLSAAARKNSYLAAERFLQGMGLRCRTQRLLALPPPGDALMLFSPRRYFGDRWQKKVLTWVHEGGHLVMIPNVPSLQEDGEADSLLDYFNIHAEDWRDEDQIEDDADEADEDEDEGYAFSADLASGQATCELKVSGRVWLRDDSQVARNSFGLDEEDTWAQILQLDHGDGLVTILAEADLWQNDHIGEQQHAQALWQLISGNYGQGALIVHGDESPSMWTLLWQYAWIACLALALLLVLVLWRSGARFGPMLPAMQPERRSLLEHLDAAGSFAWRTGLQNELLSGLRQQIREDLQLLRPHDAALPEAELVDVLAEHSGLPSKRVQAAMYANDIDDSHTFVHVVRDMETLRKKL